MRVLAVVAVLLVLVLGAVSWWLPGEIESRGTVPGDINPEPVPLQITSDDFAHHRLVIDYKHAAGRVRGSAHGCRLRTLPKNSTTRGNVSSLFITAPA